MSIIYKIINWIGFAKIINNLAVEFAEHLPSRRMSCNKNREKSDGLFFEKSERMCTFSKISASQWILLKNHCN